MRSKFQLNEGEIQRILNLHKAAILKENKFIIAEEENTFKAVSPLQLEPSKGWGNANGIKIWNAVFKPSTKIKNSLITTKKVIVQVVAEGSFYEKTVFYRKNKAYVVYNCKTQRAYVLGSDDPNAKKFIDYKSKKWTFKADNMQSLQKLCREIPEDPKSGDKDEDNPKDEGKQQVFNKQNPPSQAPEEVLRSGYSEDGKLLGNFERALTLSCDNAEFAAKSCNDRSLRAQITINDNCDDTILNDAIQNFSKGVTGVKGALVLIEDGIWGETSKAAWEACKTNMRQGTSGSSGQSGSNGSAGSSGSAGTNGSSGSVGLQGGEDLKLTDAEYVKLTS